MKKYKAFNAWTGVRLLGILLFGLSPFSAARATDSQPIEEVLVVAPRLDLSPIVGVSPEQTFERIEIEGLAVDDLDELIRELQLDVESSRGRGRGRPVILVNGRVVASFRAIQNIPTEAIERVEVFPEEVALSYGFRAIQKVVNFVLEESFAAGTGRGRSGASVGGGGESWRVESGYVAIQEDQRFSLSVDWTQNNAIHDSDRVVSVAADGEPPSPQGNTFGIAGGELDPTLSLLAGETVTASSVPTTTGALSIEDFLLNANQPVLVDELDSRTLAPEQQAATAAVSYAQSLGTTATGSIAVAYTSERTDAEQGLAEQSLVVQADNPFSPFANDITLRRSLPFVLKRAQRRKSLEADAALAGQFGAWTWSWRSSLNQTDRDVQTDRRVLAPEFADAVAANDPSINPFVAPVGSLLGADRDRTENQDLTSRLHLNGVLLEGGPLPTRGSFSVEWRRLSRDSATNTNGTVSATALERRVRQFNASVDTTLLGDGPLGQLTLYSNAEIAQFSDFDRLSVVGAGLSWRPSDRFRLNAGISSEEGAPDIAQLGDAVSRIPNRRVFDFLNGTSVNTTFVTGGNVDLEADRRQILNFSLRGKPLKRYPVTMWLDYTESRIDDPVAAFPTPNAQLESAFPERFVRDEAGGLVEFDSRPVNLERENRREARWGFRYAKTLRGAESKQSAGGARVGGRGALRAAGRALRARQRSAGSSGRLSLALNHRISFEDELLVAPGIESIDFVGISGAGRVRDGARHVVNVRGVFSQPRFSARLDVTWQAATESLAGPAGALRYDDLARTDLNLSYRFRRGTPLADVRAKLTINNLFNERPDVIDPSGAVPAGFASDELDPTGRAIFLELRKLFR